MGTDHFNSKAATWDQDPDTVVRAGEVAAAVAATVPLRSHTRLLEYGAGTALVSQAFADQVGSLTLADNSAGMRAVMLDKVEAGTLPPGTRIWDLDLEHHEPVPAERFDVVVSSLVLHHVHDLARVLSGFATLLEPGGCVAIADLDTEDGSFHANTHDFDGPHGFDRAALSAALESAGFVEVSVVDCTTITKDDTAYPVFLATARRP